MWQAAQSEFYPLTLRILAFGRWAVGLSCAVTLSLAASMWHGLEFHQGQWSVCKLSIPRALQLSAHISCEHIYTCLGLQETR